MLDSLLLPIMNNGSFVHNECFDGFHDLRCVNVKPRSDRTEVDQTEGQKASQAILEQKDKRGGGSFKGTKRNRS